MPNKVFMTPRSICNMSLLDSKGKLLKIVTIHSFEDYLGGLFANSMTKSYLMRPHNMVAPAPSIIKTPHNTNFPCNLKVPDRDLFYIKKVVML